MKEKSNSDLRKFGMVMACALLVFAALLWWRDKSYWPYLLYISAFFTIFGLIFPRLLAPIEWVWMTMARYMGLFMTRVILTLTYYLAVTPTGLIMKVFGKDPLDRKFDPDKKSYWKPVEPDGPASRPDKPY